jgi:hypothetical protein
MTFTGSIFRGGKLLVATAMTLGMLTTVSHAYTAEQEQMCTGDAMRLCSSEIPDVDRVTACMIRQRALLSDGCKALFRMEPTAPATPVNYAPSARPSKPLTITPNKRG